MRRGDVVYALGAEQRLRPWERSGPQAQGGKTGRDGADRSAERRKAGGEGRRRQEGNQRPAGSDPDAVAILPHPVAENASIALATRSRSAARPITSATPHAPFGCSR